MTIKNISKHCQISPAGQSNPCSGTTGLYEDQGENHSRREGPAQTNPMMEISLMNWKKKKGGQCRWNAVSKAQSKAS